MDEVITYTDAHNEAHLGKQKRASALESQNNRTRNQSHSYPHLRKRHFHPDAMNNSPKTKTNKSGKNKDSRSDSNSNFKQDLSDAFQCGICSQKFFSMELLSSHIEEHCRQDVFQCNMCNDIFSNAEALSAHLDLHTNVVKKFKCGICNAGFLENEALISHLKQKHEDLPFLYKCNICLLLFKEVSKLISHAAKKHPPVRKEYKCGLCDKKFTQGNRLILHVQKHSEEEPRAPIGKSHLPATKLTMHLKSCEKSNNVSRNMRRKTRSIDKELQKCEPLQEAKRKCKRTFIKRDCDEIEDTSFHLGKGDGDDDDTDSIDDNSILLKSVKRGRKRSTVKISRCEDKRPVIKNNEELIATYKRIDPETRNEVYDCDVCGERFYQCVSFTHHRADHFFDDKFCVDCQHCEQVFDNFEDLQEHIGGEGKCLGYVCSKCGKSFSLESFLLTHEVKDHMLQRKNSGKLICSICEKIFDNRTAFLRHASSHSEIKCIQCKLCRHSFTTPETLFGHLRTTHSLIPLTRKKYEFKCKVCDINFMKIEALKKHETLVHKTEHQEHITQPRAEPKKPKQKEKHNDESIVKRTGHWRSVEDDKKRRTCHICNRVFKRFKDVRRHIGTHTKPYLCSHCGKAFPYRYSLDAHIKAFHSAENPFKCELCFKFFSCPRSLIVHQRIHTGERPHQCHICDKRFRQVANLSMHLKLHNADKPIKCPLCDYRCQHKGYLKRHMSTHSKEKKHFCPICNKGFTEKPNLNHHLKRHTKIKNHVCAVCGHRFAERYYLNNHMRIHTKEKPYVCPVCGRAFTMRPNMVSHIKKTHPSYNYQPIRPSHQTAVVIGSDNNSLSLPDPCLPIMPMPHAGGVNTTCVTQSTPTIPVLPPPPPLPQIDPNISVYQPPEHQLPKMDIHSYPPRDSIIQSQILRDQQQPPNMREPQIINDPMVVRNHGIMRESVQEQNMHHEDPEKRHYVNLSSSTRMPETPGFDSVREVPNQTFSVVLPCQDYMYTYPSMPSDPFIQGFFPLTNQPSQHPQHKQ